MDHGSRTLARTKTLSLEAEDIAQSGFDAPPCADELEYGVSRFHQQQVPWIFFGDFWGFLRTGDVAE